MRSITRRELQEQVPAKLRWVTDTTPPTVGPQEIVFFEDESDSVGKILMRRNNRTWTFSSGAGGGGGVTTSRTLTAGAGLTGGGDLSADRTFAVGAGTGITVAADTVAVDQSFSPTWTGAHAFSNAYPITFNHLAGTNPTFKSTIKDEVILGTPVARTAFRLESAPSGGYASYLLDVVVGGVEFLRLNLDTSAGLQVHDGVALRKVVLETRTISAGAGLSGGGDLSADRALSVDTGTAFAWTAAHTITTTASPQFTVAYDGTYKATHAASSTGLTVTTNPVNDASVHPFIFNCSTSITSTRPLLEVQRAGTNYFSVFAGGAGGGIPAIRIGSPTVYCNIQENTTSGVATFSVVGGSGPGITFGSATTFSALSTFNQGIDVGSLKTIQSGAAADTTAIIVNGTVSRTTGDLIEFQDNGTWKWRINSAGNIQGANNAGIFAIYGLDEGTYTDYINAFGRSMTGTVSGNKSLFYAEIKANGTNADMNDFYGFRCQSVLSTPTASARADNIWGGSFIGSITVTGSAAGRGVDTFVVGGQFIAQATGGPDASTSADVGTMNGGYFAVSYAGQYYAVTTGVGVDVTSPSAPGTGTTVTNHYGIRVQDQRGLGGTAGASIRIDSQTISSSATKGNLYFAGGTYDTGHIQLNTGHIWATSGVTRVQGSAPSSATDASLHVGDDAISFLSVTTPIAQYNTTGTTTGFTAGAGTTAKDDSTYTGNTGSTAYTVGDIVRALKLYGLIAA